MRRGGADGAPIILKVLHAAATVSVASWGPAKAVVGMASAVQRAGAAVSILTTDHGGEPVPLDDARDAGVDIQVFPVAAPRFWKRSPTLADALARTVPTVDVVHLHSLYLYHDWVAGRLCRRHGVPYIVRPHGTLDPYIARRRRARKALMNVLFQNRVLDGAAALHYTTQEEAELARPWARGRPAAVIPNGIDVAEFADLPARGDAVRHFPRAADRRVVLFMARLAEKKGLDLLVPAFAAARQRHPDLHLLIAGPDEGMRAPLERWIAEHGLGDHVTLAGLVTGEAKRAALALGDVFVLPSYSENFGIAVVEAMASGLPVIVSDKVNIWREVVDGGAGTCVPCDEAALAAALETALNDPARLAAMGDAGRRAAAEHYAWSRIARRLIDLYEAVAR